MTTTKRKKIKVKRIIKETKVVARRTTPRPRPRTTAAPVTEAAAEFNGYVLVPRTFGVPAMQWQYKTEYEPAGAWQTVGSHVYQHSMTGTHAQPWGAAAWQTQVGPWASWSATSSSRLPAIGWGHRHSAHHTGLGAFGRTALGTGGYPTALGQGRTSLSTGTTGTGQSSQHLAGLGHWDSGAGKWQWNAGVDHSDPTIAWIQRHLIDAMNRPGAPATDSGIIALPGSSSLSSIAGGSGRLSSLTGGSGLSSLTGASGLSSLTGASALTSLTGGASRLLGTSSGLPRFRGSITATQYQPAGSASSSSSSSSGTSSPTT